MGVFAAVENMTSGALSVRERPFHSTKPRDAGLAGSKPTGDALFTDRSMAQFKISHFWVRCHPEQ
jgi:hypothetical protein